MMGILMEDPRLLVFLLSIASTANHGNTAHHHRSPLSPTAKPNVVPHQVRRTLSHLTPFLLLRSYHFKIDVFMITLIHFRPPAFLLLSFVLIF